MKFCNLILGKVFKFVATRCEILRLKCTKFNFVVNTLWRHDGSFCNKIRHDDEQFLKMLLLLL